MKKLILLVLAVQLFGCDKEPYIRQEPLLELNTDAAIMKSEGKSDVRLQTLIRQWTEWAYGQDAATGPITDPDGSRQDDAQPNSSGVFMLAGSNSPDVLNRSVTIDFSQYQYIFVPLVVLTGWYDVCFPDFYPKGGQQPEAFFSSLITEAFNGPRELTLAWNGQSLLSTKQKDRRANSGVWDFTIHPSWNEGCTSAATSTFYSDGYWALIPIEETGRHTLSVGGDFNLRRFKERFANQVNYTITVVP